MGPAVLFALTCPSPPPFNLDPDRNKCHSHHFGGRYHAEVIGYVYNLGVRVCLSLDNLFLVFNDNADAEVRACVASLYSVIQDTIQLFRVCRFTVRF
jgi:heme/copper-type cytochrome/quinol oxidase subunit 4